MAVKTNETDHLLNLYNRWIENPSRYGKEMSDTIDKIIYSTLNRQSLQPIYRRYEDKEDLIQELRLLCFKALKRITDPTNKRIFNFLRISIKLGLKDKARKVGKQLDRRTKESEILGEKFETDFKFCLGDEELDKVAYLLAYGESRHNICTQLSITKNKLNKHINKLRTIYAEEK